MTWLFEWLWAPLPWLLAVAGVAGLAAGYVLRNRAYRVAAVSALLCAMYLFGQSHAREACNDRALAAENTVLRERAADAQKLAADYGEKLRRDNELDRANQESLHAIPENDTACLPSDAARRLRNIR